MLFRRLGSNVAAMVSYDDDASLWFAAVVTAGGTVSDAQKGYISTLIRALKAGGSWAQMDDAWALVSESATQALVSLKQRRTATVVNSPTFAASAGYTFNGTTNYVDTGFIPSTHAVALAQDNARLSVYERSNADGGHSLGTFGASGTDARMFLSARTPTGGLNTMRFGINSASGNTTTTTVTSVGYSAISRTPASVVQAWKTGTLFQTVAPPLGVGLPAQSLWIGGSNAAGALSNARPAQIGFAAIGASLSAGQELTEYNAIQDYMTNHGAQV